MKGSMKKVSVVIPVEVRQWKRKHRRAGMGRSRPKNDSLIWTQTKKKIQVELLGYDILRSSNFSKQQPHLAARCIHWVNKMKIRSHFGWKHNLPITIMLFQEICSCTFSVDAGQTRWSWMNEDAVCFSGRFGCHSEHSLTDNPRCFDRSPISTYLVLTMLRKSQDQSKAITLQKSFFI